MIFSDCGTDLCGPPRPPPGPLGILVSLAPFAATFAAVSVLAGRRLFPRLSQAHGRRHDGDDHFLPASAPAALRQAHAEHGARSGRRRAAAAAFAATVGLAAVLAELILAEVVSSGGTSSGGLLVPGPEARAVALRVTVPALLALLVGAVPFLEVQSLVAAAGWSFRRTRGGRLPRGSWALQLVGFGAWLFLFWSVGRAVPSAATAESDDYYHRFTYLSGSHPGNDDGEWSFDSTGMTIGGRASARAGSSGDGSRLARACLERVGVIGITLMGLLSGFASVSSPWHVLVESRAYRRRPVTETDVARRQAGLDAASEMLHSKRHRLQALQKKALAVDNTLASAPPPPSGLVGKMFGSLKGMGSGIGDAAEIKALQFEIAGLETMEANLSSALATLREQRAAHARDGTVAGVLLSAPRYVFSVYCVYRVLATTLATARRALWPSEDSPSFSSSDPISRLLGLLARHWDPSLDQLAWARQASFLLSGVILAGSAGSVVQTSRLLARWAPASLVLRPARANLALATGQVAATYVISAGLLLRSSLPREVGRSVGDALEGALEPGFADRWFEGWFLVASAGTAAGIWLGRKMGGPGERYDEWDDYEGEEMGHKRS